MIQPVIPNREIVAFDVEYEAFIEAVSNEDDFEGSIDRQKIERDPSAIIERLKSQDTAAREAATAEAISLGVDLRLLLSGQMLDSGRYQRHRDALPDLEKRVAYVGRVPQAAEGPANCGCLDGGGVREGRK